MEQNGAVEEEAGSAAGNMLYTEGNAAKCEGLGQVQAGPEFKKGEYTYVNVGTKKTHTSGFHV